MKKILGWGAVIWATIILASPALAWRVGDGRRPPAPPHGVYHSPRPLIFPTALPAMVIWGPAPAPPSVTTLQLILPGEQQEKLAAAELERRQEKAYQAAREAKLKKLEARTGRPVRSWQVLNR